MKWKPSWTLAHYAGVILPKTVEKYFKAGRKAASGKRTPRQMHKFRLKTKQFRYTLELFRPVYGPSLERYLNLLHDLQSLLGKLSDNATVGEVLKGHEAVEKKLHESTQKKLKEFHTQWESFDKQGELDRWKNYLTRGARPRPKRKIN